MTQHWSPIFNGKNRGVVARSQTGAFNQLPHPVPMSSLRRAATAINNNNSVVGSHGFRPISEPPISSSSAFSTPTKNVVGGGFNRAAPQCAPSPRASPPHSYSPTSVVAFDRHQQRSPHSATSPIPQAQAQQLFTTGRPSSRGGGGGRGGENNVCVPVAENKKYKTEMCKNMMENGYCRFGQNCHYAHSEEERHAPSVEDLMKDDRLLLPCSIMVATGFCPYDHRCKSLHDPRVTTYPKLGDDESNNVVVLEHCTKAKRSGDTIPDRLYHRYLNSIRQVNPLIAPYIWESRAASKKKDDASLEFQDTYNLVCNAGPGVNVFPRPSTFQQRKRRTGEGNLYADIVNKNIPQVMLGELQKLCIVLQMHAKDDTHLDYIYAPKDCMNGQPCMVIQTRYFHLLDFENLQQPTVSIEDVVTEVSSEVYHSGKFTNPNAFVCAHEVAFDSKGKRSCNHSVWFDTMITACSSSKAKKMSKKEDPWRLDDTSGSLFCLPNNEEFEALFTSTTPPYVFMQPVDDTKAGHDLIKSILEHRVTTMLLSRGFCFYELPNQLDQLGKDFARMKAELERWAWPKTAAVDHFSKTKEEQNQTVYTPSGAESKTSTTSAIWESFVLNLSSNTEDPKATSKNCLPALRSITEKKAVLVDKTNLPRISRPSPQRPNSDFSSYSHQPQSLSESTWRELLLGEGDGAWERTIESHIEHQKRNAARPSSAPTIIQNSFSR